MRNFPMQYIGNAHTFLISYHSLALRIRDELSLLFVPMQGGGMEIKMKLKEKLMEDLKAAMKDKDVIRKNTVQMVRSSVLQYEKDNLCELDDEGILDVIAKELKKRRDVLPEYEKSGRDDLIADMKKEIETLLAYLPAQLTAEELEVIVTDAIAEVGATSMKDMGKIMAAVMPKTKGRADGKMINAIVKEKLS